jgi:dephospho-CoA kinase
MPTDELIIVSYDESWPDRAAALSATLRDRLAPTAERIEHIGSTAVPWLAAKDVLDLQISVADLAAAAASFDAPLARLGFRRLPYEHDHVPAGSSDDPELWAKRFWTRGALDGGDVNLHVRLVGSPNERLALLFRDWLRAHPNAVPAYAAVKTSLAAAVPDREIYTDLKDPIVDLVIAAAEPWARATGWQP